MNGTTTLHKALDRCVSARLTFAACRRPGAPVEIWAQRAPALEPVEGALLWEANQVFLVAPFNLDPARVPLIRSDIELEFGLIDPDIEDLFECRGSDAPSFGSIASTSKEDFKRMVANAKTSIAAGALQKVVLSRTEVIAHRQDELPALFMASTLAMPHGMIALVHDPDHGFWFGVSPERLVIEEEDHVQMDALAGTLPLAVAPRRAADWGTKESHEQDLVKQAIIQECRATGLVPKVGTTEVMHAGELAHLRTVIETDLNDLPLSELVIALHPTPAVCGTPREAAKAFIAANEAHDRSLYAGFWGPWCPDGRTELFVNIRCLHAADGKAVVFAGAGITADSDPDGEWKETVAKAAVLLDAIARLR